MCSRSMPHSSWRRRRRNARGRRSERPGWNETELADYGIFARERGSRRSVLYSSRRSVKVRKYGDHFSQWFHDDGVSGEDSFPIILQIDHPTTVRRNPQDMKLEIPEGDFKAICSTATEPLSTRCRCTMSPGNARPASRAAPSRRSAFTLGGHARSRHHFGAEQGARLNMPLEQTAHVEEQHHTGDDRCTVGDPGGAGAYRGPARQEFRLRWRRGSTREAVGASLSALGIVGAFRHAGVRGRLCEGQAGSGAVSDGCSAAGRQAAGVPGV